MNQWSFKKCGRHCSQNAATRRVLVQVVLSVLVACAASTALTQDDPFNPKLRKKNSGEDPVRAKVYKLTRDEFAALPDIRTFREQPSDQFLIDWKFLRTGHPYMGTGTLKPHTGAHLNFTLPDRQLDPKQPGSYPQIFAVANGIVTRVDEAFRLRPVYFESLGTTRANLRYGVDITFARNGDQPVSFHYSIEPMVDPGDENFYRPFLQVQVGQTVRKGDVIATMYLPPDPRDAENSHIHFNLNCGRNFQSPSIFSQSVERQFAATWDAKRLREDWPIPACMGYKLGAMEDPFVAAGTD